MHFQLNDRLRALQQEARAFANTEVRPGARERDRDKIFPADLISRAGARGWLGCLVPEKFGGSNLGNMGQAVVLEEIAAACASTHVTMSVHNSLMSTPLKTYGSEELKAEYLPKVATGEWLGAYLLTEAGSGSDAAAMKTTAVEDGDHYLINGDKMWISTGDVARLGIVFARTDLDPKATGQQSDFGLPRRLRRRGRELWQTGAKVGPAWFDNGGGLLERCPSAKRASFGSTAPGI